MHPLIRRWSTLGAVSAGLLLAAGIAARASQAPGSPPEPPAVALGDKAPDFALPWLAPREDGTFEVEEVALSDYAGKQTVVLAFFPAAFSPG